jgi:hypothetical protein
MPEITHWSIQWLHELAPLGAVVVFSIALFKYWRAESWKKTEFVAKLYKEFSDDQDCKQALWFLQGDKRKIYYKAGEKIVECDFSRDVLRDALSAAVEKGRELSPFELHIRDTLDRFFVYIEQFERAVQRKLVFQDDVYPYFGYWIALLKGEPDVNPPPPDVLGSIRKYIDDAGFDDVQKFLKRKWPSWR